MGRQTATKGATNAAPKSETKTRAKAAAKADRFPEQVPQNTPSIRKPRAPRARAAAPQLPQVPIEVTDPTEMPAICRSAPADAPELHRWLIDNLDVHVPTTPLIDGHQAPFDFLVHSFFEGRRSWDRTEPAGPADSVVWASRGGGKTYLGAIATMLDLVFKHGIEIRILGGSMEQSRRMHTHLRRLFGRSRFAPMVSGDITDRRLRLVNRSEVELLAQSQVSVRGTRVHKLRCDEVELFDPEVWEAAQLVTRSATLSLAGVTPIDVRGSVQCLSTMHLPHGLMHRLVQESAEGTRAVFRWGVVDVLEKCTDRHRCRVDSSDAGLADPQHRPGDCVLWRECRGCAKKRELEKEGHVTVDDAIAMKRRVSLATWEAEMLCLRASRTGAVYPEFDPRVHVVGEAPPAGAEVVRWIGGMDFGYRAPTVILWAAVDTANVLWIVGEHVVSGAILDEHIKALAAAPWPRPEWIGADPAGRQTDAQTGVRDADVVRRAGFRVIDRRFRTTVGLDLVRARLSPAAAEDGPRLLIHRRCVKLIESLEKYHFDERKPLSEEPVKDGPDHAADALRYMVQNLDRPPKTVQASYID